MISAIALVALSLSAPAHQVGLSRGLYTVVDGADHAIDLELVLARGEAARTVKGLDKDNSGTVEDRELNAAAAYFATDVVDAIVVARENRAGEAKKCRGVFVGASLTEEDGLAIRAHYMCEDDGKTHVEFALAHKLSTGHRHLAHVVTAGGESDYVAFASSPSFVFGADAPPPSVFEFLQLGVEHILTGFDHLVFLFGLILIGGRLRSLLAVITAFTVAHSITLGLAVMGVFAPPPSVVEPLIAASIAYVGVENFFVKNAEGRWRITAPFGLIHGFGFAGALAEVGVPKTQVPLTLFLFNLGVECGQLMVLAVVLPLLWLARKRGLLTEKVVKALSVVVIILGVFWLVQRVLTALGLLT